MIPKWRQQQIEQAAFEREQRAAERTGVLCGLDETDDGPELLACAKCLRSFPANVLTGDSEGGMRCAECR